MPRKRAPRVRLRRHPAPPLTTDQDVCVSPIPPITIHSAGVPFQCAYCFAQASRPTGRHGCRWLRWHFRSAFSNHRWCAGSTSWGACSHTCAHPNYVCALKTCFLADESGSNTRAASTDACTTMPARRPIVRSPCSPCREPPRPTAKRIPIRNQHCPRPETRT
jgi:hypothetical protein